MKKNVYKVIVCAVSLLLVMSLFIGCSSKESKEATSENVATEEKASESNEANEQKEETGYKSIISMDKKCEISIPESWSELEGLNDDANIQVASESEEDCAIVISEPKTDFADSMTIEDYMNGVVENLSAEVLNVQKGDMKDLTINGQKAKRIEITGEEDQIKIAYIITVVETDKNYHQIIAITIPSSFEENKDQFEKMINSFKEI